MGTPGIDESLHRALELHRAGRFVEAEQIYRQILSHDPRNADAVHQLGLIAHHFGKHADAAIVFRRALALRPDWPEALHNLSLALQSQFDLDGAAAALERALQIDPDYAGWNNLGNLRKAQGRLDDAIACFRRALDFNPDHAGIHSNLLLAMNYHAGLDAATIFAEHTRWAERHAARFYPNGDDASHPNDCSPDRPLRVGYVSPDLRQHPVGFYMEPVIERHRRECIEPFCYSDVANPDALSRRVEKSCAGWRDVAGWTDERVAQSIHDDRIDILVDLAGHTANHRLLVFARKPAPVQVTYLGYVNTTGLATMDYALTDRYLDPPGAHEPFRMETLYRFPRTYICYVPPMRCDDVGPLPASANGHVTFACMNNFSKVTPQTLDAWIAILRRVPGSHLLLQSDIAAHLAQVRQRIAQAGIEESRVQFAGKRPLNAYYALHNTFDIALDPFPHNGGTTTCDALWMGVPVITLAGEHAVMRAGASILSTIGLQELVADSVEGYVTLAAELANDLPRLADLRRTLRPRMASSPLMDLPGFVNDLEQAYRQMWLAWCKR